MIACIDIGHSTLGLGTFETANRSYLNFPLPLSADPRAIPSLINRVERCGLQNAQSIFAISVNQAMTEKLKQYPQTQRWSWLDASHFNHLLRSPQGCGVDRMASVYAATRIYKKNFIVFDLGSATTASVVNSDGLFSSGAIGLGLSLQNKIIARKFPHLPKILVNTTHDPEKLTGGTTIEALKLGQVASQLGFIDYITRHFQNQIGQPLTRVVTGGSAYLLKESLPKDFKHIPYLNLLGVYLCGRQFLKTDASPKSSWL